MSVTSHQQIQILHVDDEPDFAELTGTFLEREDDRFAVEAATSADEGLESITDRPPDCVVSDYNMPGMDGIEFLQAVREEYPDLPFILFTGKGSEEVASDALTAGATDYIQKQSGAEQYELLANRIDNAVTQHRSEEQLRETRKEYTAVFENAQNALILVRVEDDGFRYQQCNPQAVELIGRDEAEIVGHTPHGALGPKNGTKVVGAYRTCIERREPIAYTVTLDLPMGEVIRECEVAPVSSDGEIKQLVVEFRDITEQRQRQQELEEYGTIIKSLTDAVYVLDEKGRFTYVNDEFVELVGYDRETILGSAPSLLKDQEAVEQAERQLGRLLSSNGPDTVTFEVTVHPRDGDPVVCEDHMGVLPYEGDRFNGSVGTLRDITDRKERQRELARTHDLMANMEQMADVGAWEYDSDADTLVMTDGAYRIHGLDPGADLTLEAAFDNFHPDDRDVLADRFDECLETGEPYEVEARLTTAEGTQRWVAARGERLDSSGSGRVVRGYIRDITEAKTRERGLTELNQAMQDLLRAETSQEVADIGVEAASDILDLRASATYLSEAGDTRLVPEAQTDVVASLVGDTRPLPVSDSVAGRAYQNGEPAVITDVQQDPDVHDSETSLGSHLYLPLDDHGVLIAGAERRAAFDQQDLALGKLLARTLVAALDRVEREEAARQRQQQLSLFFDESPLGAVQWDDEFRFERVNERAEAILGYDEETLCGKSWETIVADRDSDRVGDAVENLRAADGGTHVLNTNVRKDGEMITCEWHNRAVTDADGDVQSIFSKFQDVTDRAERQQELEQTRNLMSNMEQLANVGAWEYDPKDGDFVMTDGACRIHGLDPGADLTLEAAFENVDPADRDLLEDRLDTCLETGEPYEMDVRLTPPGGDQRWITARGERVSGGESDKRVRGYVQDITEERRQRIRLEDTAARLEALFDRSPDMINVHDTDGNILDVNHQLAERSGYAKHELTEMKVWDLDTRITPDEARALWKDMGPDDRRQVEGAYECRDGSTFPVEVHIRRLDIEDDDLFVVISRDITEQTERERELYTQNERLDEFASIVSHDLQNPLTVAEGRLELAQETRESEHLARAADAIDRSRALIDDLLALAREGEQATEVESVVVADVAENTWQTTETRSATLDTDTAQVIRADRSRFKQLLENLYRNAVEHGGDSVTVSVGAMDDGFYVADTGPGIPEREREKVFQAGYSTSEDGTGFGLRIVEQIADGHGWEVTVTESEQGGVRFEITGVEFLDR